MINMPDENNNNFNSEDDFNEPVARKSRKGKSFYIALFICLVAISAAAWSTYESVKDFIISPKSESETHNLSKPAPKGNNKDMSKNSILEGNQEEKTIHRDRKLIPYANEKKPAENISSPNESSDDIQPVSAEKSDLLIVYPTGNNVLKEFSDSKPVYSKTMSDWRTHDGADFKAGEGSIIKSITGGTVKDVYNDSSYGTTIVIEHDPKFTAYYSGLGETTLVQKGQRVKSGQDIGSVNKVPCEITEEPHLHLMIYKDEKFIDPLLVLDKETQ
jgi:murein DD-endopeptidase MepM/ murein hydrolase activator NlpD